MRLSDPTGLYETRMFSDVLDVSREHLEPGMNVVLTVEATLEGDELSLLARAVQPVDAAVAGAAHAGMRIFVRDREGLPSLAARLEEIRRDLKSARRGPVMVMVTEPGWEAEIELRETCPVTPQVIGAVKVLPGVAHIEQF